MNKDERIAVIEACCDCHYFEPGAWGECRHHGGPLGKLTHTQIHPDCPLERREPWLKLREAGEAMSKAIQDLEIISPKVLALLGDKTTKLRDAIEAVKEKKS